MCACQPTAVGLLPAENLTIIDNEIRGVCVVMCELQGGTLFSVGAHTVNLKATYDGVFPCPGDIAYAVASMTVEALPAIALTPATAMTVCPGTKSLVMTFRGSPGIKGYIGSLQLGAVLNDGTPCTTAAGDTGGCRVRQGRV